MFGKKFGEQEKEPETSKKKNKKKGHKMSEELAEHIPAEGVAFGPQKSTGAIESLLVDDEKKESAE